MAGKVNFKINQGETFKHTLRWLDSAETAIDLTGYKARMHVRARVDSVDVLLFLSSDPLDLPDGTITFIGNGTISLKITDEVTSAITWNAGVYDLEMEDSLGDVTRLIEGKVTVTKEVTR